MSFWGTLAVIAGSKLKDVAKKKGKEGIRKSKQVAKNTGKSMNFMNAPKDSPGDVFSGISGMFNKSLDKVEVPNDLKKYMKDTFRLR